MTEKVDRNTLTEATVLQDGTILTLREATTIPERRREQIVADAQLALEPVVAEARRIVAEIARRRERDQAELGALGVIRWDRLQIASGSGDRARLAGRAQRLLLELRDMRTDGLAEIPSRVAGLTVTQVREQIPASIRQQVAWATGLPEAWDEKLTEVRRLARSLASRPMREIDTVPVTFPKPQRPTTAEAEFNPLAR
jgi:hypothetical protein